MTDDPINTAVGSRANERGDSDYTVIPWKRHEIIVGLCVTHGFVFLLATVIVLFAVKS